MEPATEYIAEIWRVKKDTIYSSILAVESGLENTRELLASHDARLGRTTRKNLAEAQRLEADIRQMEKALALLKAEPVSRE